MINENFFLPGAGLGAGGKYPWAGATWAGAGAVASKSAKNSLYYFVRANDFILIFLTYLPESCTFGVS